MPLVTQPPKPHPTYYVGHAGVSLVFSESRSNQIVQNNLRATGDEILALSPRPGALVVFSGHFGAGGVHGPGVIEGIIVHV